ncbi:hypothetical protein TESG_01329 [Trichophyton tonsurans CBS 112818]|uniref:Uncharacterized protein n=1 Tax=Trichophyton tonsurans (strain CBS 112818) TaxID=647933 RepID=F2RR47_TRIT1|nr:hypothetical protein TESG_01329 [Trichophyton tonsurans CBS 112818]
MAPSVDINIPLGIAAIWGYYDIVQYLLDQGTNPHWVAKRCDIIPKNLSTNAPEEVPLVAAVLGGNKKIVSLLLKPEFRLPDDKPEYSRAILSAARIGRSDLVDLLLQITGRTLGDYEVFREAMLWEAVYHNQEGIVQLLLDHGANPNDITVEPFESDNRKGPEYVTISASSSDAICIAAVTVTSVDQERSPCNWISNDGRFPMGFSIHIPDFSHEELLPQFKYKKETVCDSKPRQHFYKDINELQCPPVFKEFPKFDEEIGYENITQVLVDGVTTCKPAIGEEVSDEDLSRLRKGIKNHSRIGGETWTYGIKRRHVAKRREWQPLGCDLKNAVVVSKGYTARAICEHPSSTGPDYGNREEGMFCDMCTKKLWPFCSVKVTANCFDEEHRVLRGDHRGFKRGINRSSVHKSYEDIQVWDGWIALVPSQCLCWSEAFCILPVSIRPFYLLKFLT